MHYQPIVFVCGLHRSGTTLLAQYLCESTSICGLTGTNAPKNEGQHVQDVIPDDRRMGGAGLFGFHRYGHLTEHHKWANASVADQIYRSWIRYIKNPSQVLLEKSPPNLIRMRLLQCLFPDSKFVIITRHPAAVALATYKWKWKRATLARLLDHWTHCHLLAASDCQSVRQFLWIKYEHLVTGDPGTISAIRRFVATDIPESISSATSQINSDYFARFTRLQGTFMGRLNLRDRVARLEPMIRLFGYSFEQLDAINPFFFREKSSSH